MSGKQSTRVCSMCGGPHFGRGLCRKHYNAEWYLRNRDKVIARSKEWANANPEKRKEIMAGWEARNLGEGKLRSQLYHATHRDRILSERREYYQAHLEEMREVGRRSYAKNPEPYRQAAKRRKSRKRGAEGSHTIAEVRALFIKQRVQCAVCRADISKRYHEDHIIPLVAGGSDWVTNIQLLCPPCNLSKKDKDPVGFMQSRGFLL